MTEGGPPDNTGDRDDSGNGSDVSGDWLGPRASEDDAPTSADEDGAKPPRGLTLRAVLPNAITAAALCAGLTGIRFAIDGDWERAGFAIILAGFLDGIDGRIARLLNAQSRFGAELDSLADSLSFGTAPAIILFLWALQDFSNIGWFAALAFAICMALRLARFNAQIDVDEQPHKVAGFLTGVPAPVGAGLALLPLYLWLASGEEWLRSPILVAVWIALIAVLLISNLATFTWNSIRPSRNFRLPAIALSGLVVAALLTEPWWTLSLVCAVYLALMPFGWFAYSKVKRRRS